MIDTVVQAFSSGTTATDLFFPAAEMETIEWLGGKMGLELQTSSDTASVEVKRAYSLSDDRITWGTPVVLTTDSSYVSSLGYSYGTAGTTIPLTSRYVRFGVICHQKAGSAIQDLRVRVMLDRDVR